MTIVRNSQQLQQYPFRRLDAQTRVLFESAADPSKLPPGTYLDGVHSMLKVLECYLDVTGQTIRSLTIQGPSAATTLAGFVGALATNYLINWSPSARMTAAHEIPFQTRWTNSSETWH